MWGWLEWTWSWGGWRRQPVGPFDAAAKITATALLALVLAWAGFIVILVAGPRRGVPGWGWDVALTVALALALTAAAWWSPRNPHALRDWLQRRKRRALRKPPGTKLVGRPPRPSTLALRAQLHADHEAGRLRDTGHYVNWLQDHDPRLDLGQARVTVYREIKAYR